MCDIVYLKVLMFICFGGQLGQLKLFLPFKKCWKIRMGDIVHLMVSTVICLSGSLETFFCLSRSLWKMVRIWDMIRLKN
jgi:hypothetical protein